MTRQLLGILALAASASVAAAQQPAARDSTAPAKHTTVRSTSRGEVARARTTPHAVARDWVRADDTKGDDLYRREMMMDRKCGKSRERCGKP